MVYDKLLVNVYTCCKCGYQWTNWDSHQKQEGNIPSYCPSCKNVRWNSGYMEEERILIEQIENEHVIGPTKKVAGNGRKGYNFDFIAYDFLFQIRPQPDMFELKQILAIPSNDIEQRHELMLYIIKDRVNNANKYDQERFSKVGKTYKVREKRTHFFSKYFPQTRRIMPGCRHDRIEEIENALYKNKDLVRYNRLFDLKNTQGGQESYDKHYDIKPLDDN